MNLRTRVTVAAAVTLGLGLVVVGLALNVLLDNRLMADATTLLENRSGALLATLDTSGRSLRVIEGANDAVLDEQAWVFDAQGRAIERPPINDETQEAATSLARVRAADRADDRGSGQALGRARVGRR